MVVEFLAEVPDALPDDGRVLVHNLVSPRPGQRLHEDGLRVWLQAPEEGILLPCACEWEGTDLAPLHYRTRRKP
jgi:hypothetical protein